MLGSDEPGPSRHSAVSAATSPYDINGDGAVTTADAILVLANVGQRSRVAGAIWPGALYDVNKSGAVSLHDVQAVVSHIGEVTPLPTTQPSPTAPPPPASTATPPPPAATATKTPVPPTATSVPPTATPPAPPPPRPGSGLLFGLGDQAPGAKSNRLNQEAPVGMYASWYNSAADLDFHLYYRDSGFIRNSIYNTGRAAQLIIWSDGPESGAGNMCGRPYPIGTQVLSDMAHLAQSWAGTASDPPLYVSLFTEFSTYPCIENQWVGAEGYYTLLKQRMLEIRDIFHRYAPNSVVCASWGGWIQRWDNPANGEGRSLMPHFDDVMAQMDNQCFQAMHGSGNGTDVREMTRYLGRFGPVYVSHYKPEQSQDATFVADMQGMFNDPYVAEMKSLGLFGWSFMDGRMWNDPDEAQSYQLVRDAVLRYGDPP